MNKVMDCMSRPVISMPREAHAHDAARLLQDRGISHLVVTEHGRFVGVVSAWDLLDVPADKPLGDIMSHPALTVLAGAPVESAAELLSEAQIGCLPVVAGHRVIGIVTRTDLRRIGVVDYDSRCASCGAGRHLRPDRDGTGVLYCIDCWMASDDDENAEIGVGD